MKFSFSKLIGKSAQHKENRKGPIDLMAEDMVQHPYPHFEAIRAQGPIVEMTSGGYALSRYQDVLDAFQNPALQNTPSRFSVLKAANAKIHEAANYACHAIPFRDGEAQKKIRKACIHALSTHPLPTFKECANIAENIINSHAENKCYELIGDLSTPYVNEIMCRWFGFPLADGNQLAEWSKSIFRLFAPLSDRQQLQNINADVTAFRNYIQHKIEHGDIDNNLVTSIHHQIDDQDGDIRDVIDNAILIYMDGIENVRYGAGNVVMEVFRHTEYLETIAHSQELAEAATQEALRLHTPASIISRVASADIDLHDMDIKAGTPVYLLLGSANRDESAFESANSFVPDRRGKPALLFGHGAHSCLGGNAAITMIAALMQVIILRGFKNAPDNDQATYISRFGHRWPNAVTLSR